MIKFSQGNYYLYNLGGDAASVLENFLMLLTSQGT